MNAADLVNDDPSQVLDENSDLFLMQKIFNATSSSRRVFSEVHFHDPEDPNLTIGMGHWIGGNIADLFHRLNEDAQVWKTLTEIWSAALSEDAWRQFHNETGISERGASGLSAGLESTLCVSHPIKTCVENNLLRWASRVREGFNDEKHWFTAGWKQISRSESVAATQLAFWADGVLVQGVDGAHARGIHTRGGVASVISACSSGLGSTMFGIGVTETKASNGGISRRWSLTEVPDSARPIGRSNLSDQRLLEDWRALVAWQYYAISKGKIRDRMKAIWKAYYEGSWGGLNEGSLAAATDIPRHLGRAMNDAPFDFSVIFRS
ncbi:hypothetical protein Rleg_6570 (plasmid) [Rhizobium leguminosarum bv. trifolii WSM1325]|uniref:Uncharacterized protein n=1 Tax=Rhizobium leguminosarum bv. trifolii (strain WSM1325) TaxID=395491 RepID=C6BB52_RHILS|nr:hypothetical protein [Rhizobium leguminosarum]ACS61310.1 hypothetical protein Rleg_6570 [Rhizobium leguminosarum bv. trifolii WSM1325]